MKIIHRGITLIELLVVIAIISVLAVVLVSLINPAESGRKARDAARISDLATIKRAIDLALADRQPLSPTGVIGISSITNLDGNGLDVSKYLPSIPQDPAYDTGGGSVRVVLMDCTSIPASKDTMVYEYKSDGDTYVIRTRLESASNCQTITQDGYASNYFELGTDPGLDLIP
jgi:prepilin-type N-terminal cleavage/methylation domain-containing protein